MTSVLESLEKGETYHSVNPKFNTSGLHIEYVFISVIKQRYLYSTRHVTTVR